MRLNKWTNRALTVVMSILVLYYGYLLFNWLGSWASHE